MAPFDPISPFGWLDLGPVSSLRDRLCLAARLDATPDLLLRLATDTADPVREAVAANPAAPDPADALLARDAVARIRASLARKLAIQACELARDAAALHRNWDALHALAEDPDEQVRFAVADTLTDLPGAPRVLILALARDPVLRVSEPLIRLSPALTEADLLALVRDPPVAETRVTVARRLRLARPVAEAVVESGDVAAQAALLRNPTATLSDWALARLRRAAVEGHR